MNILIESRNSGEAYAGKLSACKEGALTNVHFGCFAAVQRLAASVRSLSSMLQEDGTCAYCPSAALSGFWCLLPLGCSKRVFG